MTDLPFACRCGTVRGTLRDVAPGAGTHLVCYCRDCRAYARHLGDDAALDADGGTDIFQTSAAQLEIEAGQDYIACLRMTSRGPLRWYAACCNSAIGNTPALAGIPFAGFVTAHFAGRDAFGPIVARVFTESSTPPAGTPPPKKFGLPRVALGFMRTTLAARLAGDHRRHPFFPGGRPLASVHTLTAAERDSAYR